MDNLYMAYDGDNAGRLVGRAVLANDEAGLSEASSRIALGHEIVRDWVEQHGGKIISGGGDEGTFSIPADALQDIEQLRADYQFSTQLTMTVGVGSTLAEAGKSLMAGKFRGKDQVVQYDQSVDADLASAQEHIAAGNASEEENKIGEAYLDKADQAPAKSHADDCKYCQEHEDHQHTDDCQWCAQSEESQAAVDDHSHTDDCEYCKAKEQVDSHEHSGDDCEWCQTAEQRAADADHDHTDDCQYCAANTADQAAQQAGGAAMGQSIGAALAEDDPNTQSESSAVNGVDPTEAPLGTNMEGNVSRPDGYDADQAPSTMGLSEDSPEQGPEYSDVLQGNLDQHAENISRDKIVGMVSQALDGFKAQKAILEKAKEQAPELYSSTIMMLKAMIEMAKALGLGAGAEEAPPAQAAAPQEGAAEAPQQ